MGEAFDGYGKMLGSAHGETKAEVFSKLMTKHPDAAEIRIRSIPEVSVVREITTHHDGHGLNEKLRVCADEPSNGGASHAYRVFYDGDMVPVEVARIQFQKGPRDVEGSTPGITEGVNLAMMIDRIEGFQGGPFACEENHHILEHLYAALALTKARADARAARGVLGKAEK